MAKQVDLDACFQSVSEGKSLIAAAVTDKGVPTAADDTFQAMAENIQNIKSDGIKFTKYSITAPVPYETSSLDNKYHYIATMYGTDGTPFIKILDIDNKYIISFSAYRRYFSDPLGYSCTITYPSTDDIGEYLDLYSDSGNTATLRFYLTTRQIKKVGNTSLGFGTYGLFEHF